MYKYLRSLSKISRQFFFTSLLFYLILFLLEIILPGFISNNFNLDTVLFIVFIWGLFLLLDLGNENTVEEKNERLKVYDYLLAFAFGTAGGIIIFSQSQLPLLPRGTAAFVTTILISTLSLTMFASHQEKSLSPEPLINLPVDIPRKKLLPANFLLFPLILFTFSPFALMAILSLKKLPFINQTDSQDKKQEMTVETFVESPGRQTIFWDDFGGVERTIKPEKKVVILILSSEANSSAAAELKQILEKIGFSNVNTKSLNAAAAIPSGAIVEFRQEEEGQATLISNLLKKDYPVINKMPSGTSNAEIMVILGTKESLEIKEKL